MCGGVKKCAKYGLSQGAPKASGECLGFLFYLGTIVLCSGSCKLFLLLHLGKPFRQTFLVFVVFSLTHTHTGTKGKFKHLSSKMCLAFYKKSQFKLLAVVVVINLLKH